MEEPGVDRHDWETEWAGLEPLVVDSPEEALSELDELVGRMLAERGNAVGEDERAAFRVAREITRRAEEAESVPPGDVAHAVGLYRELYENALAGPTYPA